MRAVRLVALCWLAAGYALPQGAEPVDENLLPCGEAYYYADQVCNSYSPHEVVERRLLVNETAQYTCYDTDFLCPILDGEPTLRCGPDCYLPSMYSCDDGELVHPPTGGTPPIRPTTSSGSPSPTTAAAGGPSASASSAPACDDDPSRLHLSSPPYENYFYSDCQSASQVVVTSPLEDSNLTIISPRLLVAWPAGNSGLVAFFRPENGVNGSLAIRVVNDTGSPPTEGVYEEAGDDSLSGNARVGVTVSVEFNSSAILTVPILGSVRTMRDFTEGPSILTPEIQDANEVSATDDGGAMISRLWLDNVTTTQMSFTPQSDDSAVSIDNGQLYFEAGTYTFTASFDYPQLDQLSSTEVLKEDSQDLITQSPDQTSSLSFLSYTDKLLAGAWRFLTYFGRDSMISLLLMEPILSPEATEAVISAVLERLNFTDGSVCHEETIGDYATYLNLQDNVTSTAPGCTYQMVDTDYFLPVAINDYFLKTSAGRERSDAFFAQEATTAFGNEGTTYSILAEANAERVMRLAAPFAAEGGQTQENLIHLKEDELVGEWRDSTYGIGGGRIPYDVNTALVPAALRAIAALSEAGFFADHPDWADTATQYAQVWEDSTLAFFEVVVSASEAQDLVTSYTDAAGFGFPAQTASIPSEGIVYHGLALEGNNEQPIVKVMNSDDCFRHYLLNSTDQMQLTAFVNQTANNILAPFPVGLSTPVGMLIANPAYGGEEVYAANFTNNAYHGTVVWSWQLAMMAAGLERQLDRCSSSTQPDFCDDDSVYSNVRAAYNHLWDLIDANAQYLSFELWSWTYDAEVGGEEGFEFIELGALPPPQGLSPTESNIRQLWSLTFLAVGRNEGLRT